MNNFIVVPDDNSILSEALEAFSELNPEEQLEFISRCNSFHCLNNRNLLFLRKLFKSDKNSAVRSSAVEASGFLLPHQTPATMLHSHPKLARMNNRR